MHAGSFVKGDTMWILGGFNDQSVWSDIVSATVQVCSLTRWFAMAIFRRRSSLAEIIWMQDRWQVPTEKLKPCWMDRMLSPIGRY